MQMLHLFDAEHLLRRCIGTVPAIHVAMGIGCRSVRAHFYIRKRYILESCGNRDPAVRPRLSHTSPVLCFDVWPLKRSRPSA